MKEKGAGKRRRKVAFLAPTAYQGNAWPTYRYGDAYRSALIPYSLLINRRIRGVPYCVYAKLLVHHEKITHSAVVARRDDIAACRYRPRGPHADSCRPDAYE